MGRIRTIAVRSLGPGAALGLAVMLNFTPGTATPAKAQAAPSTSGLYCAPGLVYVGGFCVRDLGFVPTPDLCPPGFGPVSFGRLAGCGGASSAAFASQAVSGIVRTTSQEATDLVLDRLRERRERERNRRLGQFSEFARMNWAADMPGARPVPIEAATPVSAVQPAVWAQAFGEFENRDSLQVAALNQRVQIIDTSSRTRTGGIIGGADVTIGNALTPNDALVLGITSGFQSSTTKFRGSQSEQQLDVSSIGVYGGYVIGGWSLGLTAKADFVELDSTFADFLNSAPFGPVVGSFETDGHNASVGGSLGYRFELASTGWYVEPTVGLDYTRSRFDDAAQLGLTNGSTLRGRAGATVGTVWFLNETTAVQPTLGAFAFSDLEVDNEILTFGANGLNPVQSDEGKVRGELQASMNMIFASGLAVFTRAEYRFGDDLQGGTLRAGLRYQF